MVVINSLYVCVCDAQQHRINGIFIYFIVCCCVFLVLVARRLFCCDRFFFLFSLNCRDNINKSGVKLLQYLEDKPIQRIHFVLKNFYGTRDNLSIKLSENVFNFYLNKRTKQRTIERTTDHSFHSRI